jgi:phage shock protein C
MDGRMDSSAQTLPKHLVRIHKNRKIAGVCAGLGAYFNMDPALVRIVMLALVFAGGWGILLYLIAWIVMPLEVDA